MQSDWQGLDPILPKVVLRFALTTHGALCVMTCGMLLMLVWPADNWDSPDTVSVCIYIVILSRIDVLFAHVHTYMTTSSFVL